MAKIRDGSTYLANHLSANDYYAEGEKVRGVWIGKGASILGMTGTALPEQFEALRRNTVPGTDEPLTPRTKQGRVAFFDFQCSAQKSVSILAVVAGDDRLTEAHEQAATLAFTELEHFAGRQKNGLLVRHREQTGNVCAAAFTHDASRALDPQLHTHFVVANATCDASGRWVAMDEFEMLKAIRYAGKVYQNELACRVRELGYAISEVRDAKGQVTGFEIDGVSTELRERFSKRRAEVELGIDAFKLKHGRKPTSAEVGHITRTTRSAKLPEIATSEVRFQQRDQLAPGEWERLQILYREALQQTGLASTQQRVGTEEQALQAAVAHLFERRSVAAVHEVLADALNQALGSVELSVLKQAVEQEQAGLIRLSDPERNPLVAEYGTRYGLELERWSVALVNATKGSCQSLNPHYAPGDQLSSEQREAVRAILSTADQIYSFRGVAGAGKTTTLKEVHRGLDAVGRCAMYIAPTSAAAKVLQQEGFRGATTVEDVLQNVARREPLHGAVVICDEAGLKSNRQGAALLRLAHERGLRVLLVGDVRQHVSVEAGDFLRVLETHSQLGRCEVAEIRRQQSVPAYKAAVEQMATGDARSGLIALDALGWLHDGQADYVRRAAEEYLRLTREGTDLERCLAVAPTWAENHQLTEAIRLELQTRSLLAKSGEMFTIHDSLQWTTQQKRDGQNYRCGQVIVFTRATGDWSAGDFAEIRSVGIGGQLGVIAKDGSERRLSLRAAASFDVGMPCQVEIAVGDKLLVRANSKRLGLVNGQVLTVHRVEVDSSIVTHEGLRIPPGFRQWCHGYVVTSHKAQGRTCEHVVVAAERLDAKAAYVACSRGRTSCAVHTPDKERLLSHLPDGSRRAALDVLGESSRQAAAQGRSSSAVLARLQSWARLEPQTAIRQIQRTMASVRYSLEQIRHTVLRWQRSRGQAAESRQRAAPTAAQTTRRGRAL